MVGPVDKDGEHSVVLMRVALVELDTRVDRAQLAIRVALAARAAQARPVAMAEYLFRPAQKYF